MNKVFESIKNAVKTSLSDKKRFVLTIISIAISAFLFVFIQIILTIPVEIDFVPYRYFPQDSILIKSSYHKDEDVLKDYYGDTFFYTNFSDAIHFNLESDSFSTPTHITTYGVQTDFLDFPVMNCQQNNALETTSLLYGRSFSTYDMIYRNKVMIIDESSATLLFDHENPLGKNIKISHENHQDVYTIIGVIKDTQSTYRNFLDNQKKMNTMDYPLTIQGYIPITTAEYIQSNIYSTYIVRSEYNIEAIQKTISEYSSDGNLTFYTYQSHYETYLENSEIKDNIVIIIQGLITLMAVISLFVSQQFSLKNRVFEIGIKKAIGANEFDILFQFQIESLITSFLGALIGIVLSVYVSTILNLYMYTKSGAFIITIDYLRMLRYMMILILITMFATFVPSYKASRQNILLSLRID